MVLGAFCTSPVQSLYVEDNKPSLYNRRVKLAIQYVVKLKISTLHPAYSSVFERRSESTYEARPNFIQPLRLQKKPHVEALNMDFNIYRRY